MRKGWASDAGSTGHRRRRRCWGVQGRMALAGAAAPSDPYALRSQRKSRQAAQLPSQGGRSHPRLLLLHAATRLRRWWSTSRTTGRWGAAGLFCCRPHGQHGREGPRSPSAAQFWHSDLRDQAPKPAAGVGGTTCGLPGAASLRPSSLLCRLPPTAEAPHKPDHRAQ